MSKYQCCNQDRNDREAIDTRIGSCGLPPAGSRNPGDSHERGNQYDDVCAGSADSVGHAGDASGGHLNIREISFAIEIIDADSI